jgi:tetratricopeptide (TPR) repeat protein
LSKPTHTAQDLEKQGLSAFKGGEWALAAASFLEARASYDSEGNDAKSAEMANNLCVALLQDNRPEEAIAAVEGTWKVFLSHGDDFHAAQAYGNLASAHEACGDAASAEKAYGLAAGLFETAGDEKARELTLAAISRLQLKRGQPLQALASMQSGLEGSSRLSFGKRVLRKILQLPLRLFRR